MLSESGKFAHIWYSQKGVFCPWQWLYPHLPLYHQSAQRDTIEIKHIFIKLFKTPNAMTLIDILILLGIVIDDLTGF